MPLAYWRDEYRTGNSLVNDQHQHLFKVINQLHDAMLAGHGRDVLKKTLRSLTTYTLQHFKCNGIHF
jgi:hemerythrin